jgi:hypothetical protein
VRRHFVWLVTLPLALAGAELAHAATNSLFGSPTRPGWELFDGGGLGRGLLPLLIAIALTLVVVALAGRVAGIWRSQDRSQGLVPFACVAPLVFVIQEHVESFLDTRQLPLTTVLDRSFLPGLALQLPFAAIAWLIARALLKAADGVRRLIARKQPALVAGVPRVVRQKAQGSWLRLARRSTACSGRGPPLGAISAG